MRPEIICHIMSSVDGRLLPSRWTLPFDTTDPTELFRQYADAGRLLDTDAWMFGKSTTREFFPQKFVAEDENHPEAGKYHIGARESSRLFVTVDPEADILYTSGRLRGDCMAVILGTNATDSYLALLEEKGISYAVLPEPTDLKEAMTAVHDLFGVKKISLQGGGIINGAMLRTGLIDELSLVIYPGIDGLATDPSIFEYLGADGAHPASGQALELLSARTLAHGTVWLRYRFHQKPQLNKGARHPSHIK